MGLFPPVDSCPPPPAPHSSILRNPDGSPLQVRSSPTTSCWLAWISVPSSVKCGHLHSLPVRAVGGLSVSARQAPKALGADGPGGDGDVCRTWPRRTWPRVACLSLEVSCGLHFLLGMAEGRLARPFLPLEPSLGHTPSEGGLGSAACLGLGMMGQQ